MEGSMSATLCQKPWHSKSQWQNLGSEEGNGGGELESENDDSERDSCKARISGQNEESKP